jgi:hypothetical protein
MRGDARAHVTYCRAIVAEGNIMILSRLVVIEIATAESTQKTAVGARLLHRRNYDCRNKSIGWVRCTCIVRVFPPPPRILGGKYKEINVIV